MNFCFCLQLVLRDNDLVELPKALGNLTRLKELHLQNNRLTALPPELGEFMTTLHVHIQTIFPFHLTSESRTTLYSPRKSQGSGMCPQNLFY